MNVDNQTIVHVKAGQIAPMQLISCILAKKPNVWGVVVQDDEDGLCIQREDATNLGVDDIKTLMENAKHRPLTMYFGKLAEGYDVNDIQPFIISDGDEKPFFTLFIEGDITGHTKPEGRTEQGNFADAILIPQILEWCEDFGGDLDKIVGKINGEIFNKNILGHVGHRAVIHIVPHDGEVITLGKNELGETEEWGMTSQTHNYQSVEEQKPAKPVEAPAKGKFFAKKATPTAAPAKASVPGVHTVGATTATDTKVQDAATPGNVERPVTGKADGSPQREQTTLKVPSWIHKNGDIKAFYQFTGGYFEGEKFKQAQVPSNWKKRIPVDIKDPEVRTHAFGWQNLDDMHASILGVTVAARGTATAAPLPPSVAPPPLPQEDNLPIIPAKDLEKILDLVAKLDSNSKKIIDPKEMQALETHHQLFSESVGVSIEETLNWPLSALFAIGRTDARGAVLGWNECRAQLRQAIQQGFVPVKFGKNVVTTETKIGTNGKKVESVDKSASQQLTAAKPEVAVKKGFFAKKVA